MFNWFAERDNVKKRIGELEGRIAALREELRTAKGMTESTKTQRILDVREQELERAKFHLEFIEYQIAKVSAKMRPR